MTEGLANQWAQNYIEAALAAWNTANPQNLGAGIILGDHEDFLKALNATFTNPNKAKDAHTELTHMRQGNKTAEEFFASFDQHRRAAGYVTGYDEFLIQLLESAINRDLLDKVYAGGIPSSYDDWKKRAIQCNGVRQRLRNLHQQNQADARGQGQPHQYQCPQHQERSK
jgi:hypothetical protein